MSVWENFGQYCNDRNYAELTVEGYGSMLRLFERKMGISVEKFVSTAKRFNGMIRGYILPQIRDIRAD